MADGAWIWAGEDARGGWNSSPVYNCSAPPIIFDGRGHVACAWRRANRNTVGDWGGHPQSENGRVSSACVRVPWGVRGAKWYPLGGP
eukprot:12832192-Alexandrium_andersonii.AAC.1